MKKTSGLILLFLLTLVLSTTFYYGYYRPRDYSYSYGYYPNNFYSYSYYSGYSSYYGHSSYKRGYTGYIPNHFGN